MTARWFVVVSRTVAERQPIMDDGSGPLEHFADAIYVRTRTPRRARSLAVRAWRRRRYRLRDYSRKRDLMRFDGRAAFQYGDECPFTGITVEEVPEGEVVE